jgi:hypothetical protein
MFMEASYQGLLIPALCEQNPTAIRRKMMQQRFIFPPTGKDLTTSGGELFHVLGVSATGQPVGYR